MRFHRLLALALPLLLLGGCEPLPEKTQPERIDPAELGYLPLDSLPAEWGPLVAVTPHFGRSGPSDWYELWFSDPDTGRITLVPVWRPDLAYPPSIVTVIERAPAGSAPAAPGSAP